MLTARVRFPGPGGGCELRGARLRPTWPLAGAAANCSNGSLQGTRRRGQLPRGNTRDAAPRDASATEPRGPRARAGALRSPPRPGWRRVQRPAVRHFRVTRRGGGRHFRPLPVWTVGGGRPAAGSFPSPSSLPPCPSLGGRASRGLLTRPRSECGGPSGARGWGGGHPRPTVGAPRHPARRRHGHEADAAHLLGPHAARGGSGLQRHHALRLLSDQRLQRWQTYAPPGRYRRLDRDVFGS